MMRFRRLALLLGLGLLAACERPPESAYLSRVAGSDLGQPAGTNARGEACLARPAPMPTADLPVRGALDIVCAGWTQPAARVVRLAGPTDAATLDRLSGGIWMAGLQARLICDPPISTRLASGAPARMLECRRRVGGWPHLALVAAGPGGPVLAEGIGAALPVVERLVAETQATGTQAVRSDALGIAARTLLAEAYGATEIGRYEALMQLGRGLHDVEDFTAAADAFRGALAVQQRVLGGQHPDTTGPLTALGLSLAAQGRSAEATAAFARAAVLAPAAADPLAAARLDHYRGVAAMAGGDPAAALPLLARAAAAYASRAPADLDALADGEAPALDVQALSAVMGLAEARRAQGVALGRLGRGAEGQAMAAAANRLLRRIDLQPSLLVGRSLRSQAIASQSAGRAETAARLSREAAQRFGDALPGERPEASARFAAGRAAAAIGQEESALAQFRAGLPILKARQRALPVASVMPFLDLLADRGLTSEMFEAAQFAQREQTTRLIALSVARLAAAGGDSAIGAALRQKQDADRRVQTLLAERDAAEPEALRAIDARITEAEVARAEADAAAAAGAPGYRQLLALQVEAEAVQRWLNPDEALVSMLIGPRHGHIFVLRAGQAPQSRRIALGEAEIAQLVERVRATVIVGADGRPPPFDTAAALALHEAVMGPVAPLLAGVARLLVVADGPMLSLPFNLLLTGPADPADLRKAPWLLRNHAITHLASAQALVTARANPRAPTDARANPRALSAGRGTFAGFADPVVPTPAQLARHFPADRCAEDARLVARLPPLPQARREVELARRLLSGGTDATLVRTGAAFTAAALDAATVEGARVLHFATHAVLPGELSCLEEPALMVSPAAGPGGAAASFLPASTVLNWRLSAELVVLSACNTGTTRTGAGSGGEGLSALARAFLFAGARGLLATHWSVDDEAALLTVLETLRRRERLGEPTATALRAAQLQLLEDPDSPPHPFYWAPFALIGDADRPGART
jgi:CHAT domain-containing protein